MSKIIWDQDSERKWYTGVEQAAIYPMTNTGTYGNGEGWNGLVSVTESPSGAEATGLYANDKKYGEVISAEEFGGTIEAYMYPDGFAACNGEATVVPGMKISQQTRIPFGLVYKNLVGNDTEGIKHGYELNIVYGARVTPSEKAHQSISESTEPSTMSWEFTTTPVAVEGYDPTAKLTFVSTDCDAAKLAALEAILYGTEAEEPRLPLPAEIIDLMSDEEVAG